MTMRGNRDTGYKSPTALSASDGQLEGLTRGQASRVRSQGRPMAGGASALRMGVPFPAALGLERLRKQAAHAEHTTRLQNPPDSSEIAQELHTWGQLLLWLHVGLFVKHPECSPGDASRHPQGTPILTSIHTLPSLSLVHMLNLHLITWRKCKCLLSGVPKCQCHYIHNADEWHASIVTTRQSGGDKAGFWVTSRWDIVDRRYSPSAMDEGMHEVLCSLECCAIYPEWKV